MARPEITEPRQVADSVWVLPIPTTLRFVRHTLVYALRHSSGIVLVDAGWDGDQAWQALTGHLRTVGLGNERVTDVLLTHWHRDHVGLSGVIAEAHGARVHMSASDRTAMDLYASQGETVARLRIELDEVLGLQDRAWADAVPQRPVPPAQVEHLSDGSVLDFGGVRLEAVATPGHSDGHLCYYEPDRKLLFTGDHVLPHITPNVSVQPVPVDDPLSDFITSLRQVEQLDVDQALPGHGDAFTGLDHRVSQILDHHFARLDELVTALRRHPGTTATELVGFVRWSRPVEEFDSIAISSAAGETMAHLVYLEQRRQAWSTGQRPRRWWAGPAAGRSPDPQ